MVVFFDNMVAVFIAALLVLLLGVMHTRDMTMNAQRNALHVAKTRTLELADLLTRDLSNAGGIRAISASADGHTDRLRFWKRTPAGDTLNVEYRLVPADTVTVEKKAVVLYELRRSEGGAFAPVSSTTLQAFEVELLDQGNMAVESNLERTRQIRLAFVTLLPFRTGDTYELREAFWRTTLRPRALAAEDA